MDQTDNRHNEKRNFIRMRVNTPAKLAIKGQKKIIDGICQNLSGGGMLIETGTPAPLNAEVKVVLAAHHAPAPMLKARAQVARVTSQADGRYVLGLEIVEMLD